MSLGEYQQENLIQSGQWEKMKVWNDKCCGDSSLKESYDRILGWLMCGKSWNDRWCGDSSLKESFDKGFFGG